MTTDIKEFNPQEVERLKRNLRETSMNEGSVDLACRCADSLKYIEQLEAKLSTQTADTIDYHLPATRTKPARQFTMWMVPDIEVALIAAQAGLPFGPNNGMALKRFSIALSAAAVAANTTLDSPALRNALDIYETQTKALPFGHEIRDRGYSAYNWQMAAIRDIRALLKERP